MPRRVEYFKWETDANGSYVRDDIGQVLKKSCGEANFHQFGVSYEEFEAGPGNFTTAILELDDGNVISVDADMIRFIASPLKDVKDIIDSGRMIDAIKKYSELFGISLKEAKEACDKLRAGMVV